MGFPPKEITLNDNDNISICMSTNEVITVEMKVSKSSSPSKPISNKKLGKRKALTKKSSSHKKKFHGKGTILGTSHNDSNSEVIEEKPLKHHKINLESKEEIGESLLTAISDKSKQSTTMKFLRKASKNAVNHQYDLSLANARLKAALSKSFEIKEIETSRHLESGLSKLIHVKFKVGVRKWHEEEVISLSSIELQAIIKYVKLSGESGKEMLKPFNMAQCSPRVFWSIARLSNGNIIQGIKELVPDENWEYLNERYKKLSEKALEAQETDDMQKEQKEQRKKKKQRKDNSKEELLEIESEDVTVIQIDEKGKQEQLIEQEKDDLRDATKNLNECMALAAIKRHEDQKQIEIRKVVNDETVRTTTEKEKDSLESNERNLNSEPIVTVICDKCEKRRRISLDNQEKANINIDPWFCSELSNIGRDGNCSEVDDELAFVVGKEFAVLLEKNGISSREKLAETELDLLLSLGKTIKENNYSESTLEAFIVEAREQEIDDIMLNIVGEEEFVQLLQQCLIKCPLDLLTISEDELLRNLQHQNPLSCLVCLNCLSLDKILRWKELAQEAIEMFPWMEFWS